MKYPDLAKVLAPIEEKMPNGAVLYKISDAMRTLRKLRKVKVTSRFPSNDQGPPEVMTVQEFLFKAQKGGANAKTTMFDKKKPDGTTQKTSVYDHFKQAHNVALRWPELPLVDMGRKGHWPMEALKLERYNRYPFKLGPNEVCTQGLVEPAGAACLFRLLTRKSTDCGDDQVRGDASQEPLGRHQR